MIIMFPRARSTAAYFSTENCERLEEKSTKSAFGAIPAVLLLPESALEGRFAKEKSSQTALQGRLAGFLF